MSEKENTNLQISKSLTATKLTATKNETPAGWECAITGYISVEEVDRDGDLILIDGIEYDTYLKNPVVLWSHDKAIPSIGRCVWIKPTMLEGKKALLAKVVFGSSEFAQEIYASYEEGSLSAFSIGFDTSRESVREPTDEEKSAHPNCLSVIERCSLNEFSCVNIPANYSALVERKQKGLMSSEFQKVLKLEEQPQPEPLPEPERPTPIQVVVPRIKKPKLIKRKKVSVESQYLDELERLDSKAIIEKALTNLKNRYRA